jgi:glycosyltransferase involved in cell wall biosynthesis
VEVIRTVKEKYPQVHGLMVGDGPLKNDTVRNIQQAGLEYAFTFTGYQQDVRSFIDMSNLLMLTSDTEGMPGVVLEAAAMAKMTITSDVGGILDFLISGENGLVVSQKNVSEFADNLIQLIENPTRINQLARSASANVTNGFGVDEIAIRYLNFFKKLKS